MRALGIGDPADPIAAADPWSRQVLQLKMWFRDQYISCGTGIIIHHERPFLLTALHNLTGREPVTLECKSKTGALPNRVTFEGFFVSGGENLYDGVNEPSSCTPLYWRHPKGNRIDVALVPLTTQPPSHSVIHPSFIDPAENAKYIRLYVSQTCHIIGYPDGITIRPHDEVVFPIWKTGHLASDPYIDIECDRKLFIDATTRPGMSGSPVVVRDRDFTRFVGIYAGRQSEIGYVFKPPVINEILQNGPSAEPII